MLIKLHNELTADAEITLEKFTDKENASLRGAFSQSETLCLKANAPRVFGVREVVLRIRRDGEEDRDIPFETNSEGDFSLDLSLERLGVGLYWYCVLFLRGENTLFTDSVNNVDFSLLPNEGARFRLLVYEDGFKTPEWFHGSTMYQIFPDRFFKSAKSPRRADAENEDDWYAPISQFGREPGAPVKNDLFYGGDLYGICEKLDYLEELGITVIYLNPIFEAYSNHKYDTGDYEKVDSSFGSDEASDLLIKEA